MWTLGHSSGQNRFKDIRKGTHALTLMHTHTHAHTHTHTHHTHRHRQTQTHTHTHSHLLLVPLQSCWQCWVEEHWAQ